MPSITLTCSTQQAALLIAAMERSNELPREAEEGDTVYAKRFMRNHWKMFVKGQRTGGAIDTAIASVPEDEIFDDD